MLNNKVDEWFIERGLDVADPNGQMVKLYEEVNELHNAIYNNDMDEIIDALGDIQVVLRGLGLQLNLNLEDCLASAYDVIKHRTGKLVNGIWVKDE